MPGQLEPPVQQDQRASRARRDRADPMGYREQREIQEPVV